MTESLNKEQFLEKVFDYEKSTEWNYDKKLPAIIDFYADWCGPCQSLAPVLEELSEEYEGKIKIYKINTEEQPELAGAFGIRSIPSLLFCPRNEQAQMAQGALPKSEFKRLIKEVLKVD